MSSSLKPAAAGSAAEKRALLGERLRKAAAQTGPAPVSFAQQRLWFLDQLEPNSALYNIASVAKVNGKLDLAVLEKSFNALIARHGALRTKFAWVDEDAAQVVDANGDIKLRVLDLTAKPENDREAEAKRLIREEVNRPFNLTTDRLIRATVIVLGGEERLLVLTIHHIIADEWSMKVFFRELGLFYDAFARNQPAALPPLPIQYTDYSIWQRQWLTGEVLEKQLSFWKERLSANSPLTALLPDRPRTASFGLRGRSQVRELPPELSQQLSRLASREEATLFMVLLAAFKTLVCRYTQQEDVVIGSPIAGRNRLQTEGLIGFFVNTLPLRTDLSGNPTFRELLRRVRVMTLGAYAHQDVPFDKIVEALHPERSDGHLPFTRLMFAVQNDMLETFRLGDAAVEFLEVESETAKFEVTLVMQETKRGLLARIEYNTELFEDSTMERLLEHLQVLLEDVVADPEKRLYEIALLSEGERKKIIEEWNDTRSDYPRDKCIHELFEAQVERTPEATAVSFGPQTLTYRELNARANQLAHYLRKAGVGPEVPVGICVQRSVDMVVGLVAVLKAGGAYVPLDANYPQERLGFMLEDTQAPVLLTQQRLLDSLPHKKARAICLDTDWELVARESQQNLANLSKPEHLAYVMYTSGSTGVPKGVAVPHRGVSRLVLNTNYITLDPTDRIAQVSTVSFDAATFEIWGALLNGAQLVGITRDVALSPKDFARELREQGITAIFLTSALFNQVASEAPGAFKTLRTAMAGGEALDPKWVRSVLKHEPPQRLVNGYGPTENTTFTCCFLIREVPAGATNIPIGRPLANTQVYILDAHLNPVPIGVPGELYTGGDGLARGYWKRPELTVQKFVPNPFGAKETKSLLYRTGDLARYLPDGNIEFLGRMDGQVKLRGFRIELGEIETVLGKHPGVRECVVAVRGAGADKRLVAYFVVDGGRAPNVSELRHFLEEKMPAYMVPSIFVPIDTIPLTANGKVDRNALPAPDKARPEQARQYASPRDEVEQQLTTIWENVLGVRPIGIEDKFFDLGGHSLLAVRLIAQIEKTFGKKLRLATIFQTPTIEQLAAIIREEISEHSVTAGTSLVPIQSRGSKPPLFFVHGAGGGMFWGYVNLSRHLGLEQPVYGFRSRGLDGREEFDRIPELAAHYVEHLRGLQPHGPYYLGGYCFGGNVAYEMARQLSEKGEAVALLALLNCAPPNSSYTRIRYTPAWSLRFARNLLYWGDYFRQWSPPQRREFFRWKWANLKRRLSGLRKTAPEAGPVDAGDLVDLSSFSADERKIWEAHIRALVGYQPPPYSGRVHLFRSPGHPLLCSFERDYGWGRLAKGGVTITVVPGAHEKILEEPCVGAVAGELGKFLGPQGQAQTLLKEKPQKERAAQIDLSMQSELQPQPVASSGANHETQARSRVSGTEASAAVTPPPITSPRLERPASRNGAKEHAAKPLSFVQQRIWFLNQLEPAHPVYNYVGAIRFDGDLNPGGLERAVNEVVRRHEVLRTRFLSDQGAPAQSPFEPEPIEITQVDLSAVPASEWDNKISELALKEKSKPFDLTSGEPLIRSVLLRLAPRTNVLLLATHEIAADPASLEKIAQELTASQIAAGPGRSGEPAGLPKQYSDFASWQREQASTKAWLEQVDFWKQKLGGAAALLEFPTDRARPAAQTYRANTETRRISKALAADLSAQAKKLGIDESLVLFAALTVLLRRYSRQDDILVGTTVDLRDSSTEALIGNFRNLVANRMQVEGDAPVVQLLERVCKTKQEALAHAGLPFERLLEEIHPARDQSFHPICQVHFSHEKAAKVVGETEGLPLRVMELVQGTTKFDLSFVACGTGEDLTLRIDYATDLFQPATIQRMLGHWDTLAQGIVTNPEGRISELPLMSAAERELILRTWNQTDQEYPREKTLAQLFNEQVAKTPKAEAVVSGDRRLTYEQLQAYSNIVAERLRSLGVGHETLVGVCLERSWEMLAAILGTLQAGAAYVPIDPAYPQDRVAFMLGDAKAHVLITQRKLLGSIPKTDAQTLCVEDLDWQAAAKAPAPLPGWSASSLAYVIYTSGSTGQPKGVALEHGNAVALVCWAKDVFTPEELSGVLASTSVCFDLSVFEMFVPLCLGGKVILAANALALPTLAAANEVKMINTVPSAIRELLRLKAVPDSVQVINLAGEPLVTPLVNDIYRLTRARKVYDLYGPTETTTYSTFTLREAEKPATIGRPLANEQVYLLDAYRQPVPIGVPGELYIGGDGVTRGYLHRPEMTAERYVADPFKPGKRLYKTGDLARWREDGNLEYLGRIDHQVKIRGFRIELGEIESVLKKHAAISETVVVAREDQPGDKRLVAYVVFKPGNTATPDELRAAIKQKLPEYMAPSVFVTLDALPLTPNGKVDRKALPAPDQDRRTAGVELIEPRTPVEKQLAAIWCEVLQVKQVGIKDNFFDLGGHSLSAIQAISRIREQLNVELPLSGLFDAPTIASLAEGLAAGRWGAPQAATMPLNRVPRTGPLPVSFVQERLWFLDQLEPGSHAYNVPTALRLSGSLKPEALEKALNEIISRHEALRTTFKYQDGNLEQVVKPTLTLTLGVTDLESTEASKREDRAYEAVNAEAQRPFDLAQGPLIRARLVKLGPTDHVLIVVMHHTVSDGWSLAILYKELEALYSAFVDGAAAPQLAELPLQYADFAAWKRQTMSGPALDRELAYWKEKLTGAPAAVDLPVDLLQDEQSANRAGRCDLQISGEIASAANDFAQREGATPFVVLMTTLGITLHKWAHQEDLVLGTVVAGRSRREIENLIGCFMNFLPIRTHVSGSRTGLELLRATKAAVLEAYSHDECPFEKIVESVNPERHSNRNPLYNVALLLQNFPGDCFQGTGLRSTAFPATMEAAQLDIRIEAQFDTSGLTLACEYRTSLFERATIEQFLASYELVLKALVNQPESRDFAITAALEAQARAARRRKQQQTLAIAATFTAEPVAEALGYWLEYLELPGKVEFAEYNQIFQQLLDPTGLLATNDQGLNVLLLRLEDWQQAHGTEEQSNSSQGQERVERSVAEFVQALKGAAARTVTPHLVCVCPPSTAAASDPVRSAFLARMESAIGRELEGLAGVYWVGSADLAKAYPVTDYYDASGDELGHVPYTPQFFTALGTMIARKWHALKRQAHKVIVLDCDQTLWSGVCGEDGPKGIRLEPPRMALQQFMRAQLEKGMLLCFCSKNNEEDVHEVFAQRLEMPLHREHIAGMRLNWLPKSENLRSLAKELNLGLDSFIFVDDNPMECAEVEANCPEVLTLLLPENPEAIPQFLDHCWVFDHLKLTAEDRKRSEMYRQNQQREQLRAQAMSLTDFVTGLELKIQVAEMTSEQISRAAQLTQRTNQFNTTTKRRTEAELLARSEGQSTLTVQVSDRFGDYGLAGLITCEANNQALDVDSFLLSCRVLGRGVEHRMLAALGELARTKGLPWVDVHFVPSKRNQPALNFLEMVGASFKQPRNGGYVFRFPAGYAADVTFTPQNMEPPPVEAPEKEKSAPPVNSGRMAKFTQCRTIALEASTPAQIHQKIEARTTSHGVRQTNYRAPSTQLETDLCQLWQRLLHVERVGVEDNFFELGGHSLLAVRLFADVEKMTGRKFPLITLFQAPTVEKLAAVLGGAGENASASLLVPIQPKGSRPPLYLIHGAGGDVLWGYANLAAHLSKDQPLYGVKSRGQVGQEEFATLDAMAAHYVKELRAFQPHGPYYLGGYCFGGNVAYEMARQIREQGEEVGLVALLDSAPSNIGYERIPWWQPTYGLRFARNFGCWWNDFKVLPARERTRLLGRKARSFGRLLLGKLRRQPGPDQVDLESVIDFSHFPEHELRLWQIHLQALVNHTEQPYPGAVTLLRTQGQALFCSLETDFRWGKVVQGGVDVRLVPGSHENVFMEPNVQSLAKHLEDCLTQAQAKSPAKTNHQAL